MSKKTLFDTRFWSDNYVSELNCIEKLVFNYLLTNSHISLCGIYELPLKLISLETAVEKEELNNLFNKFEKDRKIIYRDGWICVLNYPKHQNYNKTTMVKALSKEISHIPEKLLKEFIGYEYPIDTLCIGYKDKDKEQVKDKNLKNMFNKNGDDLDQEVIVDYESGEEIQPKPKKENKSKEVMSLLKTFKDMAEKETGVRPPESKGEYFALNKAMKAHKLDKEDVQELFTHFFADTKIAPEKKVSIGLCISGVYISQWNVVRSSKQVTQADAASEIIL